MSSPKLVMQQEAAGRARDLVNADGRPEALEYAKTSQRQYTEGNWRREFWQAVIDYIERMPA